MGSTLQFSWTAAPEQVSDIENIEDCSTDEDNAHVQSKEVFEKNLVKAIQNTADKIIRKLERFVESLRLLIKVNPRSSKE